MKKNINMEKIKSWIIRILILVIIILVIAVICYIRFFVYNDEETITVDQVNVMLEESSELTTAKLNYTGILEYNDKGFPIINKSNFVMVYDATVRTGINIKEVNPEVDDDNKIVWITIPKAEIQEVTVDHSSIRYYDEKFSLFNVDEREDVTKALAMADEDAKKKVENTGALELADKQAETLIKGILQGVIPEGYELKIRKVNR